MNSKAIRAIADNATAIRKISWSVRGERVADGIYYIAPETTSVESR